LNHPFHDISVQDDLTPGAWNAVNVCLRVQPEEKVTLITDRSSQEIGADWISSTHIDVMGTKFDIWIDDRKVMAGGRFLL
jgi:leucyl aminopeptidase (aminopeptidase T)